MGVKVFAKRNENVEDLIRRFRKACDNADVIRDYKRHSVYEKPSDKRKREAIMRKKNILKKQREPKQSSTADKFHHL